MNLDTLTILVTLAIVFAVAATLPDHEEPGLTYKASWPMRFFFLGCLAAVMVAILRS